MGWAPKYAEPGYDQPEKCVLMANWNEFPRGLDTLLERAGYSIEWSDEWTTCESCNGALRTQPDGYSWEPSYKDDDTCGVLCLECYADEHPSEDDEEIAEA